MLEICEIIGKMSSEKIIFALSFVTMATTLTKKYTTVLNFCFSIQKIGPQYPSVLTKLAFCVLDSSEFYYFGFKN